MSTETDIEKLKRLVSEANVQIREAAPDVDCSFSYDFHANNQVQLSLRIRNQYYPVDPTSIPQACACISNMMQRVYLARLLGHDLAP